MTPSPAVILNGGQGGGFDPGVTAGSLAALHGDAIALGRQRADAAHAHVGDRVAVMLGDGTRTHATVVAIYTRALAFGDALLAPELAAGHQTSPLLGTILVQHRRPRSRRPRVCGHWQRGIPGLRVSDRASLITATDSRARDQPLARSAVRRDHLRLHLDRGDQHPDDDRAAARPRARRSCGSSAATRGQVRSMARWEAGLIITIGLGLGLAIAAAALLPLSHALTGSLRPYVPLDQLAAILGVSALLALLALALPTRRALRSRPIEAIGLGE